MQSHEHFSSFFCPVQRNPLCMSKTPNTMLHTHILSEHLGVSKTLLIAYQGGFIILRQDYSFKLSPPNASATMTPITLAKHRFFQTLIPQCTKHQFSRANQFLHAVRACRTKTTSVSFEQGSHCVQTSMRM